MSDYLSSQVQQLTKEQSRITNFIDTYETQKAIRTQLKKDFINSYNIYLTKKKEYDDAVNDYKNYVINNKDNTFQIGNPGMWNDSLCSSQCSSIVYLPDLNVNNIYKINNTGNPWYSTCQCIFPNYEIAKKKLDIMNLKKKESEDALALSINLKKKFEEALQEI